MNNGYRRVLNQGKLFRFLIPACGSSAQNTEPVKEDSWRELRPSAEVSQDLSTRDPHLKSETETNVFS